MGSWLVTGPPILDEMKFPHAIGRRAVLPAKPLHAVEQLVHRHACEFSGECYHCRTGVALADNIGLRLAAFIFLRVGAPERLTCRNAWDNHIAAQEARPFGGQHCHSAIKATQARRLSVQAFETEGLIGTGAAPAVLAYLFHRIEGRLDGRPALLIIDEGWLALDDAGFAGQLREWLKTLRNKNASVVFATQSLSDIDASAIAPAIIESCPTRLFLPNERAIEPQISAIYRRFGLNDRQIEILAHATPKRDYYCQSRRGNRLFELGLGEVALAFTAASSKSDHAAIERIFAEHGHGGFAEAWLRERGVGWAADLIPHLTNMEAPS